MSDLIDKTARLCNVLPGILHIFIVNRIAIDKHIFVYFKKPNKKDCTVLSPSQCQNIFNCYFFGRKEVNL